MRNNRHKITVCSTDAEIMATFPIMKQLRKVEESTYCARIKGLIKSGYHLIAYTKNGQCIGAAGYHLEDRLHTGKMIYIADIVVDEQHRSSQCGSALINWIKKKASELNCNTIVLDSGVQRSKAHKFYFNNGFNITSYNFKLFNL